MPRFDAEKTAEFPMANGQPAPSTSETDARRLLDAVERIRPVIEHGAAEADASRQLSAEVYDTMEQAGLFAMLAPRVHGGLEVHPVVFLDVIEAMARIDPAAAWNLGMNQLIATYASWLPARGAAEVYSDGPQTVAGALHPPASAVRAEGGWRLTGQVPFGSGCHHARWLGIPAMEMDGGKPKPDPVTGQPVLLAAFFRRADATILDTWHTLGMRGTGSADYAIEDLFVPDHLVAPVDPSRPPAPGFEGPLYRMGPLCGIIGEAAVSVGIAAEAVEAAVRLCVTKTAAYNAIPLRDQQLAHFLLGKARARVEASRDTIHRAAAFAYAEAAASNALLSTDTKIRLQLAVSFAAEACAEAVRLVNDVAGTSSIRTTSPFERYFRDTHTLLQHSDKSSPRYASAGRLMLGLENDWVWLSF